MYVNSLLMLLHALPANSPCFMDAAVLQKLAALVTEAMRDAHAKSVEVSTVHCMHAATTSAFTSQLHVGMTACKF